MLRAVDTWQDSRTKEGLPKRRGRFSRDNWASYILDQSITFIAFTPDRRQGNDKANKAINKV